MSDDQDHSETVSISSDDVDGQGATTHTEVTENGKKVVDEIHGPGDDSGSGSGSSGASASS